MTFLEMQQEVARQTRMNLNRDTHETYVEAWLNLAQLDMGGHHNWWWWTREYSQTLSNSRTYAFPATDSDGNAAVLQAIDTDSMRTANEPLIYAPASVIDRDDEDWTITTGRGTPTHWTLIGKNIALNRIPSAAFLENYSTLYFRGQMKPVDMSADGDESVVPDIYHPVLIHGALKRAWIQRGDERMSAMEEDKFLREMERMTGETPLMGYAQYVAAPAIFRLRGSRRHGTSVHR